MSTASSRGRVGGDQRYRKGLACPICGGSENDDRGTGSRCHGYLGGDGLYAHCTREEKSGGLSMTPGSLTFAHKLKGECKCGVEHGPAEPKAKRASRPRSPIAAKYDYKDEAGAVLFQVVRKADKTFFQQRPGGMAGVWKLGLEGVGRVLYRLPELASADPAEPVFFVEGEKDVENLRAAGLVATCNPMGAGKWRVEYARSLAGRVVYIVADNDDLGRDHARTVAKSLDGIAAGIKWLDLAEACRKLGLGELPEKGDASDFLKMGGTAEALKHVFAESPGLKVVRGDEADRTSHDAPDPLPRFGNHHVEEYVDGEGRHKLRPVPHPLRDVVRDLDALSPGWPKRVQERLFVESDRNEPVYLGSSARLFSWLDQRSHVDWTKGSRFITQERFYENRRMNARRYESIEIMPHVPPMPGAYYMHRELPHGSGKLDELVARFLPASEADRQLIKALIVTPLWGGLPGTRPAFLVTGPDFDPEQGRGLGKSSMLDLISDGLYGGSLAVSQGEDIGTIKTRILSEEGSSRRIMRLDNLKTLRFSWSDLEDMITAPTVSGRMLYIGEGQRRNDLVWILTLNGASLSKDMAQRVVTIKLARPPKGSDGGWRDATTAFIQNHRWEIIADVAEFLSSDPGPMKPMTRWAAWERDILSKLADPGSCQRAMMERQEAIDSGNEDRDIVRDALCERMSLGGHDPDTALLKIPSKTMAEIVTEATRKQYETAASTTFVKGLAITELIQLRKEDFRGWLWNGARTGESEPTLFNPPPRKP